MTVSAKSKLEGCMHNYPLFDSYEKIETYCMGREISGYYLMHSHIPCFMVNECINRNYGEDYIDANMNAYVSTKITDDAVNEEEWDAFLHKIGIDGYITLRSKENDTVIAFVYDRPVVNVVHVFFTIDSFPICVTVTLDLESIDCLCRIVCDAIMNNQSTPILNTIIDMVNKSNNDHLLLNF